MTSYLYPIEKAMIHFPIIAFLLTIPYMLYNYRKYGSISMFRSIILFTFFFYLQCAFYLVILPLPNPSTVVNNNGPFMQLVPFNFISEFINNTSLTLSNPSSIFIAIKENVFIQPLFNIILTIPFGIYLGYYFKKDLNKVFVYSLLLSVFFEVTQLTGIYGLYSKPYRLFDVDDILLNTLGGVIGYFTHHLFNLFLPNRDKIDQNNIKKSEKVGYIRRMIALIIDMFIITIIYIIGLKLISINSNLILSTIFVLYFILVPTIFNGKTLGKKFVNIKISKVDSTYPLFFHLLIKYGCMYLLYLFFLYIINTKLAIIGLLIVIFIMIDFIKSFRRKRRLWYELLSKTKNESEIYLIKEEKTSVD